MGFFSQLKAVLYKNLLLSTRQIGCTITLFVFPVVMMSFIFLFGYTFRESYKDAEFYVGLSI